MRDNMVLQTTKNTILERVVLKTGDINVVWKEQQTLKSKFQLNKNYYLPRILLITCELAMSLPRQEPDPNLR